MKQKTQKRNMLQLLAMIYSKDEISFIAIETEDLDTPMTVAMDERDMPAEAFLISLTLFLWHITCVW